MENSGFFGKENGGCCFILFSFFSIMTESEGKGGSYCGCEADWLG